MGVNGKLYAETYSYGRPAEEGGPSGEFFGSAEATGDSSGGYLDFSVEGSLPALQNRLFLFRRLVVGTAAATARQVRVQLVNDRATQGVGNVMLLCSETVVSVNRTTVNFAQFMPVLWRPIQRVAGAAMLIVNMPNTNSEVCKAAVWGEYWELATLRQGGKGPLIRW